MAEAGPTELTCARDRVRFERLSNPGRPEKELLLLYDGPTLVREVGENRKKIMEDEAREHAAATQRRIRVVDSKKVLMKGEEERDATPSSKNAEATLETIEEVSEEGEEVKLPSPVRICSGAPAVAAKQAPPQSPLEQEDADGYFTGDTMCAWCDDGGSLVMCDGPCMRGFHMDRDCNPLGVPEDLKAAIVNGKYPFECPNCWSRTHRCFKCMRELKLDVTSDKPLLVKCDFADCGKFYCLKCQDEIVRQMEVNFQMNSRTESAFICPLHFCCNCGTWEDASTDILFPCRRCPKAMHYKCMPRKIRDNPTRIWKAVMNKDGTLSEYSQVSENFFYCGTHQTQNMMQGPLQSGPLFTDSLLKRWRTAYALKFRCLKSSEAYIPERHRRSGSEDLSVALAALNIQRPLPTTIETDALRIAQKKRMRARRYENEAEMISAMQEILLEDPESDKCREQLAEVMGHTMNTSSIRDVEKELTTVFPYHRRQTVKLTEDRLDSFIHSVERAKTDSRLTLKHISDGMIQQMKAALKSMRISCAPFLQPKYTSYGRHFTKTHVLKHIANHVIGFLKPNDLVVDFSCGANEFIGIIADFCKGHNFKVRVRAYDLFTPFRMDGFVRKNWFQVTRDELDKGENLVVGLNPPFGVNASLANQFVLHAVKFKPRLIILVCPPETLVPHGYTIIHENLTLCKDKAFYIPGLRADQWNGIPPPFRILQRG